MTRIHQTMSKPKPTDPELTKAGKPRQRAPGAGAPDKGRKTRLSLVSEETRDHFKALATAWECSIADAIERAAAQAVKRLPPTSPAHKKP